MNLEFDSLFFFFFFICFSLYILYIQVDLGDTNSGIEFVRLEELKKPSVKPIEGEKAYDW